jgi:hypothetical protein
MIDHHSILHNSILNSGYPISKHLTMAPPDPTPPEFENLKQPRPINPAARKPSFPLDLNSPQPPRPALPANPLSQVPPSIASLHDLSNSGFIPLTQPTPLQPPIHIAPLDPTRPMGDFSSPIAALVPPPPALHKNPQSAPAPQYHHTVPIKRQHSQFQRDANNLRRSISQAEAIHAATAALQAGAFQAQSPQETIGQRPQPPGPQYTPSAVGFLQGPDMQPQLLPSSAYYNAPLNPAGHPEGEVTVKYQLVKGDPTLGPNGLKYGQDPYLNPHVTKRTSSRKRKPSAQSEPSFLTAQDQGISSTPTHPPASSLVKHPVQEPDKDNNMGNQQS